MKCVGRDSIQPSHASGIQDVELMLYALLLIDALHLILCFAIQT